MNLIKFTQTPSLTQLFEWKTGYHIKDREKLIELLTSIQKFEQYDNVTNYVKRFRSLPEFDWKKRPFSSISEQTLSFFADIELLSRENPLKALKLSIVLACHEEILSNNEIYINTLKLIVQRYFFLDSIPLEIRLTFCILCVKNWPITSSQANCDDKKFFFNILPELFILYANEAPQKALFLFETQFPQNSTYFFSSFEDHLKFLRFISNYIEERPQKNLDTICDYLNDVHSAKFSEESIREFSQKLYEITKQSKFTDILTANHNQYLKRVYSILLKKSYPDESWYPQLAYKLWEIDADNPEIDKNLLGRYCTIVINAPDDFIHIDLLCQKYKEKMVPYYKNLDINELNEFEQHAKTMLTLINHSLCDYPWYRNCYTTALNISKVSNQFIDTVSHTYFEMLEWLLKNNLPAYFYALKVAIQKDNFECEVTHQIALDTEKEFFKHIEELTLNYPKEAIHFIGKIIGYSQYSEYKKHLFPFLDRLIPVLIRLDSDIAKAAVQQGLNYQTNDRQHIWKPKDLHSNPIYKGVIEPEIFYI